LQVVTILFLFILILAVLVKVFAYDFAVLAPAVRTGVLITLGLLLIGLSAAYPRLRKLAKRDDVL
jgi:hypothetical protein